ncbi:MAG TPA: chemotaxis protein CheD, partial [Desulfomonilia bacterium]|nr:chemotaxis protein CheD [Desulfomonilia bacterium]
SESISVGRKNIETAMKFIKEQNMRLTAWDMGGDKGRKVIFYTDTGEVFMKYVTKLDPQLVMYNPGIEQ